jgi:hypothetical protein
LHDHLRLNVTVLVLQFFRRSFHLACLPGHLLRIGISFAQLIIEGLQLSPQALLQAAHVLSTLLKRTTLFVVEPCHEALLFLLHGGYLLPEPVALLASIIHVEVRPLRPFRKLPGAGADLIGGSVAGSDLVALPVSGLNSVPVLHLRTLAFSRSLPLPFLLLTLTSARRTASLAAFTLSLAPGQRHGKGNHQDCEENRRSGFHALTSRMTYANGMRSSLIG